MSLESGNFIKDLVITNPEGTDPKSQGDDHLRLIKAILKSQFAGFTQGKSINRTEDEILHFTGRGTSFGVANIDTMPNHHAVIAWQAGMTGTVPVGGGQVGDIILHLTYDGSTCVQFYYATQLNVVFTRRFYGTLGNWQCVSSLGTQQSWSNQSRAQGVAYTNTTGRPIQVSINCASSTTGGMLAQLYVAGIVVSQATSLNTLTSVNVHAIVPNGQAYQLVTSGTMNIANWAELRA